MLCFCSCFMIFFKCVLCCFCVFLYIMMLLFIFFIFCKFWSDLLIVFWKILVVDEMLKLRCLYWCNFMWVVNVVMYFDCFFNLIWWYFVFIFNFEKILVLFKLWIMLLIVGVICFVFWIVLLGKCIFMYILILFGFFGLGVMIIGEI